MKRYIWSPFSKRYHDREHLSEKCNTDQLKHRRTGERPPIGKVPCKHCGGPR